MFEKKVETEEDVTVKETRTSIDLDKSAYTKTKSASGADSIHSGDFVAETLAGMNLEEVTLIAIGMTGRNDLYSRYSHLNAGMQRMSLGNLIRGAVTMVDTHKRCGLPYAVGRILSMDSSYIHREVPSGAEALAEIAKHQIISRDKREEALKTSTNGSN